MGKSFSCYKDTPKYITKLSRQNRANPTVQEESLWQLLSEKRLNGLKFRRQYPIGRYIVDFYNHAGRLVIEVDGEIHCLAEEYDKNRDEYLRARGYSVMRFTNMEVETNIEAVVRKIQEFCGGALSKDTRILNRSVMPGT